MKAINKLISITLKYTSGDRNITDYPLFMTDGKPIAINIHIRNEETGEFEVERTQMKRKY